MRTCPRFTLGITLFSSILPVTAEIREFDLVLPPSNEFIHFTHGYLRAPGYIDITSLTFEARWESFADLGDDMVGPNGEVDDLVGQDNIGNDDGQRRTLSRIAKSSSTGVAFEVSDRKDSRQLDRGVETEKFFVDVAVFREPGKCAKKKNGCNWTELGLGAKTDNSTLRWCCSEEAIDMGLCPASSLGRLILKEGQDEDKPHFSGDHRTIEIPISGSTIEQLKYGKFEETRSGRYVVVFANCYSGGREIHVTGHSNWKSTHGFLPGELYGFMYFYGVLALVYAVLMFGYAVLMHVNKESRIPIEKWIFMTITMGLGEMIFRSSDYFLWNLSGHRPMLLLYLGIVVGVLKRGVSRVLMVMVSLGWGVIRDSLGSTMNSIVVLGAAYIGVSAFRDLMVIFVEEDVTTLSYEEEEEIFDIVTVLTFVVATIDVVFILWILDALNGTMQYLENMSQLRKLQRYLSLRSVLLFAILFSTIWVVFSLVDNYDEDGIVREEHEWVVDAATEVNYFYGKNSDKQRVE